jgi:hypothetical protein
MELQRDDCTAPIGFIAAAGAANHPGRIKYKKATNCIAVMGIVQIIVRLGIRQRD